MSIKATVIGSVAGGPRIAPTSLGGGISTIVTQPKVPPQSFAPTQVTNNVATLVKVDIKASSLPGVARKSIDLSLSELVARFPNSTREECGRIKSILSGIAPDSWTTASWLNYGVVAQEQVTALIRERMAIVDCHDIRTMPQHLKRMQRLLTDSLSTLTATGMFTKPSKGGWNKNEREICQLADLLDVGSKVLVRTVADIDDLIVRSNEVEDQVKSYLLSAEYLITVLPRDKSDIVLSRQMALATSQALIQEHIMSLHHDSLMVQNLIGMIHDGVLLRLPAVSTQMANTPDTPNDTQRFLAVEKISELVQYFERKTNGSSS